MYGWIVRSMIRRALRRRDEGDIGSLLGAYADDVHFVFPGDSSWAADIHGKRELEPWLRRFAEVGLRFEQQEIVVTGWPWNTTICVQYTDHATDPSGNVVYENRGVIMGKIAWGKIKSYEVFEDTQKVAAFDEYLASQKTDSQSDAPESSFADRR